MNDGLGSPLIRPMHRSWHPTTHP